MKSYFFIPGNKLDKIQAVEHDSDELIIDLEDALRASDRESIAEKLICSDQLLNHWLRIPIRDGFEQPTDFTLLRRILAAGYKKIVIPKLKSVNELKETVLNCKNCHSNRVQLILIVEHPLLLLQLKDFIPELQGLVKGISLGSHDLMAMIRGKHSLKNLEYPRQHLLYIARATEVEAIDIASMELKSENVFEDEINDGFEKGFDGKFLIHPWQLSIFNKYQFFSQEDVIWAQQVLEAFNQIGDKAEFVPIKINGEVIERPHLQRAKIILQKNKHYDT